MSSIESAESTLQSPQGDRPRTLRNYVAGGWREAGSTETLDDVNPATGELNALVPLSGAVDVDAAVVAARAAQPEWRGLAPQRRARAVMALREALWANREELARLVTEDMGKTLDDARGEVLRGIESTEAACAIPHLLKGEGLEGVATGVDVDLVRQPVGVVGAITPFNFPTMIPLWFLPFAIACGNTFVLKPSERDPRPSELIFELIDGIDQIPAGVCSLVHGARDAVNALLDHPEVDAISFVGQAVHRAVRRGAVSGHRQALSGARRSQELARGDAGRRSRQERAGDHGIGVRGRGPAMPRGVGRGAGRRSRPPGRGPRRSRRRRREIARWPGRRRGHRRLPARRERRHGSESWMPWTARRPMTSRSCSTAAASSRAPQGRCWGRRSSRPATLNPKWLARSCSAPC